MLPALATLLREIEFKVQQTQRRKAMQVFLHYLPICLALALLLGITLALLIPVLGSSWPNWEIHVVVGTGLLGLLGAALVAWFLMPERQQAALAMDRAFDLKERVITLTTLKPELQETEAAKLLAQQMQERVAQVHISEKMPLQWSRRPWYAPMTAVVTLLLALAFPTSGLLSGSNTAENIQKKETKATEQKPIDISEFKQTNEERKKRLKEIGSADLHELQKEIDLLIQKLEKTPEGSAEAKLAIEDATRLAEKVRQQETLKEKVEEIKKQLKLEMGEKFTGDRGPAEEFAKALAKADFKKARKEMSKLAEKLKLGEMSREEMKELAKQMQNLQQKLEELSQQKEKLDALEKSDLDPETKAREKAKIEKEIEKLKDLAELAQQMKEAAEQMEKGELDAAREALEKLADELGEMELTEQEMNELQLTEGDLQDLKNVIAGMKGKGSRGNKKDPWGQDGDKDSNNDDNGRPGMGRGKGQTNAESEGGLRDEKLDDVDSQDSNAKTQSSSLGKLQVVGEGPKQGKPGKDQVKNRINLSAVELDQAQQQASEALKQQRISQSQKNVVNEFYKNLAPGK
ncbi:MAG TPA: hypothetical protein PKD72_06415 [Gemmatales bacterium]|nr:hypothetical protein [Gemmatales bacterium]